MTSSNVSGFDRPITAVVQGASRGLGLAFVRELLKCSNVEAVLATCRSPKSAAELQSLAEEYPRRLTITTLNLIDENSIAEAASVAHETIESVDLLLNVAGVLHDEEREMGPEKKLDDVEPTSVLHSFRVNSLGPLLVIKHFKPLLRNRERAVIANLSARVGSIGDNHLGGWYAYRASKAAQNMFTRTAAIELGRYRRTAESICVALHPGTVDTDLSRPFQSNVPDSQLFSTDRAARQLLDVVGDLKKEDTGTFFDWAGKSIEW